MSYAYVLQVYIASLFGEIDSLSFTFDSPSIEVVALYLNAQRLAPLVSDLLMLGLRFEGQINRHNQLSEVQVAGLVLNNSVFVELHKNTKIGVGKFTKMDQN
jgi:hypothetical protein